ncbi:MAG: tetratricopeptide repeat protein [Alphaproteobacteria bacterium]|nr:tetratricopeptide repeat protein [Alphaproteobacteria bacterium]
MQSVTPVTGTFADPSGLCSQGEQLLARRQPILAEQVFQQALTLDAGSFRALSGLGLIALERNDLAEAIRVLTQACAAAPGQPTLLVNLGNALARSGQYSAAIGSYDAALKLAPNILEAHYNRSTALLHCDRPAEAADGFRKVLAAAPNNVDTLFNLGLVSERLQRLDDVVEACRRLLRLAPRDIDAHVMHIRALWHLRRVDEIGGAVEFALVNALDALRLAHAGNLDLLQSTLALIRTQLEAGEAQRVMSLTEFALRKYGKSAELNLLQGNALAELMRQADAVEAFDRAVALDPQSAEALTNRGNALFQLGRFEEALASYDRALDTGQGAPTVLINLVAAKRFERDDDVHLKLIENFVSDIDKFSPTDQMFLHFAVGKAFDELGRYTDAFDHWVAGNLIKRRSLTYKVEDDVALASGLTKTLTAEWLGRHRVSVTGSAEAPIFVFGMPRSGTTLVEQLLAGHSDTSAIGEAGFFRQAMGAVLRRKRSEESYLSRLSSLSVEELAEAGKIYAQLARVRGGSDRLRLVDKTLTTSNEVPLVAAALPNAFLIHVRRNAMDNCLACFSMLFTGGNEFTYDLGDLAAYRQSFDAMVKNWSELLPGRLLEVDYESLVGDFEAQARRIFEFCQLPWSQELLEFDKVDRAVRSASAYQVRQPLFSSSVGRWRHYRFGLSAVEEIFGPGP